MSSKYDRLAGRVYKYAKSMHESANECMREGDVRSFEQLEHIASEIESLVPDPFDWSRTKDNAQVLMDELAEKLAEIEPRPGGWARDLSKFSVCRDLFKRAVALIRRMEDEAASSTRVSTMTTRTDTERLAWMCLCSGLTWSRIHGAAFVNDLRGEELLKLARDVIDFEMDEESQSGDER